LRGDLKYVYVHGHEERLYDLAQDPHEWENRIAVPRYAAAAAALKQSLLHQFDPDRVAAEAVTSQENRRQVYRYACAHRDYRQDSSPSP
jgi:choline-sulfatase